MITGESAVTGSELTGRPGHAEFEVRMVQGRSTVTQLEGRSPLKLLAPQSTGPSAWLFTSSFGGGMVAGDSTRLEAAIHDNARCFLGTQSSTKIYRCSDGLNCRHQFTARVGESALLVLAPDPVQCFAEAAYQQHQRFDLAASAGLVLVDWCQAGRVACGERWALKRYASRNEVWLDGRLAALDSTLLDPAIGPLDAAHRLGRFNCVGIVLITGALLASNAREALAAVAGQPVERRPSCVLSASPVRGGTLIRFAAEHTESAAESLHSLLRFTVDLLGDDPWARKW